MRKRTKGLLLVLLFLLIALPAWATTITYWHPQLYPVEPVREIDIANEFMAMNPDVRVQLEEIPTENMAMKMTLAIAGDCLPNVARDYLGRIADWGHQGILVDLTGTHPDEDDFFPDVLNSFVINGELIGYPGRMWIQTYNVNKLALDKVGMEMPSGEWGLEEWMAIGEKVKTIGLYPTVFFATGRGGDYWMLQNFQIFGARLYKNQDYTNIALNSDEGIKALEWMIDLVDREWVPPGAVGMEGRQYKDFFDAGKAVMGCLGTRNALPKYQQEIFESGISSEVQDFHVVTPPCIEGQPVPGLYAGPSGMVVFKNDDAEKKEAAIRFAQFLTTPKMCEFWARTYSGLPVRKSTNPWVGVEAYEKTIELVNLYGTADMGITSPHYLEIRDLYSLMEQEALSKMKTPQQALNDFANSVRRLWE